MSVATIGWWVGADDSLIFDPHSAHLSASSKKRSRTSAGGNDSSASAAAAASTSVRWRCARAYTPECWWTHTDSNADQKINGDRNDKNISKRLKIKVLHKDTTIK
jgi:hypothetical protein